MQHARLPASLSLKESRELNAECFGLRSAIPSKVEPCWPYVSLYNQHITAALVKQQVWTHLASPEPGMIPGPLWHNQSKGT